MRWRFFAEGRFSFGFVLCLAAAPAGAAEPRGPLDPQGGEDAPATPEGDHLVRIDGLEIATHRYAQGAPDAFGGATLQGSVANPTGTALQGAEVLVRVTGFGGRNGKESAVWLGSIPGGGSASFTVRLDGIRGVGSWALTVRFEKGGERWEDVFLDGSGKVVHTHAEPIRADLDIALSLSFRFRLAGVPPHAQYRASAKGTPARGR